MSAMIFWTGHVQSRESIQEVIQFAAQNNLFLLVDEVRVFFPWCLFNGVNTQLIHNVYVLDLAIQIVLFLFKNINSTLHIKYTEKNIKATTVFAPILHELNSKI